MHAVGTYAADWQPTLQQADRLSASGDHEAADAAYRRVLTQAPGNVAAHLGLGKGARRQGDRAACLSYFQAAAALAPHDPWPLLDIADELREQGRPSEAAESYHAVLGLAPDMVQAHRGLGHCARQRGDAAASLAHFRAAAALAPSDPDVRLEVAEELLTLGMWDAAETAYRQVLAVAPGCVPAFLGLGKCAKSRGDPDAALGDFKAAAAASPSDPWPWLDIADHCRERGRLDDAEAAYHRVLLLDRARVQAWLGLGHCARQRGLRWQAVAHFHAAALAAPAESSARLETALDLLALGLPEHAERVYRDILAAEPANMPARRGLGFCARKRGDRRAAIGFFRQAEALDPADPSMRLEIAADLRELGDLAGAEAICRAVAEAHPNRADAYLGLGHCARARGDREAALCGFRRAAVLSPDHVGAQLELAFDQRESGDVPSAIETAKAVLLRHPDNLQAMLSIGLSERRASWHEAALASFQRAHAAWPAQAAPLVEMAIEERALGRQDRCDDLLSRAYALDPQDVGAVVLRAEQAMLALDAAAAHHIYAGAAERQPGQLAFRLGVSDALAALGRIDEALQYLDALEAEQGALPAILAKRLYLLRRDGDHHAALALARRYCARLAGHDGLWCERIELELLVGTEAEITDALAAAPAAGTAERATLERYRGRLAERNWDLPAAVQHYERAAAARPEDAGIRHDLLRAQVLLLDVAAARASLQRFCQLLSHVTRLQNRSLNTSQTHFGQIIDEYRMDVAVPAAFDANAQHPPRERVQQLRRMAQAHPDSTAVAVSLLIALRRLGTLARRRPAQAGRIPKVIAQYWDGATPPADVTRLMRTWAERNPDHEHRVFDHDSAMAFMAASLPLAILQAYRRAREPAQKADIFRLAWLATNGGIYVDADDRCLAPLSVILPEDVDLALFQEDLGTLGNDFIAARPGHPLLLHALERAAAAINRGDSDLVWLSTGPALLTRAFAQLLPHWGGDEPALPPGTIVLDRHDLFQAVATGCMTGYKKTAKHWPNSSFAAVARMPGVQPGGSAAGQSRSTAAVT